MLPHIAVITTNFLSQFTDEVLSQMQPKLYYTIYTYDHSHEICDVYRKIPPHIKGVVTSGMITGKIIQKAFSDSGRIIMDFNADISGIYKHLATLFCEIPHLDINRVYVDFLDMLDISVSDFLIGNYEKEFFTLQEQFFNDMSVEQLIELSFYYEAKHKDLWKKGMIDISLTRFSNLMNALQEQGIKVKFAYPGEQYVQEICLSLAQNVLIESLRDVQVAVVVITFKKEKQRNFLSETERLKRLTVALKKFGNGMCFEYILQPRHNGLELWTQKKEIERITENLQNCALQSFLDDNTDFSYAIGYGIGKDLYQAQINAINANKEAAMRIETSSCLIDGNGIQIMMNKNNVRMVIDRNYSVTTRLMAQNSGLSPLTLEKIRAVMGQSSDRRITSGELARKLIVSRRAANIYLSALLKANYAEVVGEQATEHRGRKEKIYIIKTA